MRWLIVFLLANEDVSGLLFEISGGWAAQTRWQRSAGYGFPTKRPFTPEEAIAKWDDITKFGQSFPTRSRYPFTERTLDENATNPSTTQESMGQVSCLRALLDDMLAYVLYHRLLQTSTTQEMRRRNCRWCKLFLSNVDSCNCCLPTILDNS